MFVNPKREFLYSAYRLETYFETQDGSITKMVSGTGFFVAIDNLSPVLISNRHVFDLCWGENKSKYRDYRLKKIVGTARTNEDVLYSFEIDATIMNSVSFVAFSENYEDDVALFFRPVVSGWSEGAKQKIFWHFQIDQLANESYFRSDLRVFDQVAFSGFPEEYDQLNDRPIMRSGHISSDPKYDFSIYGKAKGRCVAFEGYSNRGSSGSPVMALARVRNGDYPNRQEKLVGVVAGHLKSPDFNHVGLSYFYKSTVILDILSKNGIEIA